MIVGGLGVDYMTGGAGIDTFDFNSVAETSKIDVWRDVIGDFQRGVDKIDLKNIDASTDVAGNNTFTFIGTSQFHNVAGEIRYAVINEANNSKDRTIIRGDINGDGKIDFDIQLTGLHNLTAGDFIL